LLPRLDYIRQYAYPEAELAQRIALSATVPDPAGVAGRYLQDGLIVNIPGGREIVADIAPLYSLEELVAALGQRPSHKSLIFCNSREEVESTAVYLRQHLPYHADIFVHYSNLDAQMRLEVEERFAEAATAVCVCTSTLELGIDIGSVDDIVLLGAPTDLNSFLQRIGRGSRRISQSRVLCLPKSPSEWARFEALLTLSQNTENWTLNTEHYAFRPSVLIQQIFSFIKQSPSGSMRLTDLRRIAPPEVTSEDIRKIVTQLSFGRYLQSGRLGEWKPDQELQELLDKHEIYTNIGGDVGSLTAVDAHSGRTIAQTDTAYPPGTVILFGGKAMRVAWVDKYRFGLAAAEGAPIDAVLRFAKSAIAIPFNLTQAVARALELQVGQMTFLPQERGIVLFHFWGTVWGMLLAATLQEHGFPCEFINEYALSIATPLPQLPLYDEKLVQKAAKATADILATRLEMGRFHSLLPGDVAQSATLNQLNLPQFAQLYTAAQIIPRSNLTPQLDLLLQ
jgi:Lhr-like helicase